MIKKLKRKSKGDIILDAVIYLILILLVIVTLYPVWYVVVASFCDSTYIAKNPGFLLWPDSFNFEAYKMVFEHPLFQSGFKNSITILLLHLPLSLILTTLCGYYMATTNMYWKKPVVALIMFTMFFSGGLIPSYLNMKSLGLYNTIWALVFPGSLSVYNAIICKTAIEAIPESLRESAYIDGANDLQILWKIILPLIKPTLAVLALYYGVAKWNDWFQASVYIRDNALLPIQNILRAILLANDDGAAQNALRGDNFNQYAETIKYAAIVISTLPIMCVYPFLQKYFTKGVMVGAVKG